MITAMDMTELTGSIAATITTLCWLPQAIHIIRTKETAGVSALTYAAFSFGVLCWLIYGLMLDSWPIIIGNTVTFVLSFTILVMKLVHTPRKSKTPHENFP